MAYCLLCLPQGPNLMQGQRLGSMQRPLATQSLRIQRKKEERGVGCVCAAESGVCVGRGEGKYFLSYDLHQRPSHRYITLIHH